MLLSSEIEIGLYFHVSKFFEVAQVQFRWIFSMNFAVIWSNSVVNKLAASRGQWQGAVGPWIFRECPTPTVAFSVFPSFHHVPKTPTVVTL